MDRAHGEIRFLRKKEKKNRTSKSVSKKDEKTAGFSESKNHVISAGYQREIIIIQLILFISSSG